MVSYIDQEIASQPASWRRAVEVAAASAGLFPRAGERVAVVGCGTSWFMAMSYAVLREQAGQGETDAFAGSEFPDARNYDRLVVLSRSGTTSEVLQVMKKHSETPTLAITAVSSSPIVRESDESIVLDFADEESVVQTRFATTALALLRASLGEDLSAAIDDAEQALTRELGAALAAAQFTFVARGWGIGLAHEAALKMREAAQLWTESYPAMDYRHGPIAIAEAGRAVWSLGALPAGLSSEVEATGADLIHSDLDPLAELIVVQRAAVEIAERAGLDPDRPRHLTRSVMLETSEAG